MADLDRDAARARRAEARTVNATEPLRCRAALMRVLNDADALDAALERAEAHEGFVLVPVTWNDADRDAGIDHWIANATYWYEQTTKAWHTRDDVIRATERLDAAEKERDALKAENERLRERVEQAVRHSAMEGAPTLARMAHAVRAALVTVEEGTEL